MDSTKYTSQAGLPAGKYTARFTVNNVQSIDSNEITIRPEMVTAEIVGNDSGPQNNQGIIHVQNVKEKNKVFLYLGSAFQQQCDVNPSELCEFKNLRDGTYIIYQEENGISGPRLSDISTTIKNGGVPEIILTPIPENSETISGNTFRDPGYRAIDFPDVDITDRVIQIPRTLDTSTPGKFNITYSVTNDHGKTATANREVTVLPKTVSLESCDTDCHTDANGKGIYGKIPVSPTNLQKFENELTEITLYNKEANFKRTKYVKFPFLDPIEFTNVPVGEGYYVTQIVNGEESKESNKFTIKDDTPPKIKLKGAPVIELSLDEPYHEYGVLVSDNTTSPNEIHIDIEGSDEVNTSIPGNYIVKYTATDKEGNISPTIEREIIVRPAAVIAIGSLANFKGLGEVGVKNIYSNNSNLETNVTLYKCITDCNARSVDGDLSKIELERLLEVSSKVPNEPGKPNPITISSTETTAVFTEKEIGFYFVIQEVKGYKSKPSNLVEIVDTDKPHITLEGPEKISIVFDKKIPDGQKQYFEWNTNKLVFKEPGAVAKDYIDGEITVKRMSVEDGNEVTLTSPIYPNFDILYPGTYTLVYNATAVRGKEATEKKRVITVTPKPPTPERGNEPNTIKVNDIFKGQAQTVINREVTLYDMNGVVLKKISSITNQTMLFEKVPAGLGYTVTQTVNGMESVHSEPVDIYNHPDAIIKPFYMSSFTIKGIDTKPVIDHMRKTIQLTVPANTDLSKLIPIFTVATDGEKNPIVKVEGVVQQSNSSEVDFSEDLHTKIYKITDENPLADGYSTEYTVTIKIANVSSAFWKQSFNKNITLKTDSSSLPLELSAQEKLLANSQGVSYLTDDLMIHMSALTAQVNTDSNLSIRKLSRGDILQPTDQPWLINISNIVELTTDYTKRFVQPIEIEQNASITKVLVRLSRVNGVLYAFTVPSRTMDGRVIGLATEPGIYALVDATVQPIIKGFENKYTITSNGLIRYKTDDTSIHYIKSSNDPSLNGYEDKELLVDIHPTWNIYDSNETIKVKNNLLYAVNISNKIISSIEYLPAKPVIEWNSSLIEVDPHKVWAVTFNARVNQDSLINETIRVTENATGAIVPTRITISPDGKTVKVAPVTPYARNKAYKLWVDKETKGHTTQNSFLTQPVKKSFYVK
ncbi:immunoglobulin-like domain-containing protein [Sporosarcina sp. P10]|uniref:immunoglobulin-like domain-containing protein n=1 Tax=Sporosarcina sp. P10 TaxID=2048264 RepID=UPI0011819D12|nr:immunoglobulin-like domain-containing protein [Sporosarcina sp. P10]